MLGAMAARTQGRRRKRASETKLSAAELARAVRKPTAPPARVEKPSNAYDRRRRRRELEQFMEES
jgi:hypothetical protein